MARLFAVVDVAVTRENRTLMAGGGEAAQVFIARRADISEGKLPFGAVDERSAWQMPQGGVDEGEEIRAAGAGETPPHL